MNVKQEHLSQIFKVLSNPTRLKIYQLILAGACEPDIHSDAATNCAKKIARTLQLNQPTVSNHVKELVQARLVIEKKNGKHVYLFGVKKTSEALHTFATDVKKHVDFVSQSS